MAGIPVRVASIGTIHWPNKTPQARRLATGGEVGAGDNSPERRSLTIATQA